MAIVSVEEDFKGRTGVDSLADGMRLQRVFIVTTDEQEIAQPEIFLATDPTTFVSVPQKGDSWARLHAPDEPTELYPQIIVRDVRVAPKDDSALVWQVTVEYSDRTLGEWEDPNPLNRPARVQWGFIGQNEEFVEDCSIPPKPVRNSAGVPYDPAPVREVHAQVLRITWNVDVYSHTQAQEYKDAVNEDSFQPISNVYINPGKAKISGISAAGPLYENGIRFWEQMVELKLLDNWDRRYESWGVVSNQPKDEENPEVLVRKPIQILQEDGTMGKPAQLLPLDSLGRHKDEAGNEVAEPYAIDYRPYNWKTFQTIHWPLVAG